MTRVQRSGKWLLGGLLAAVLWSVACGPPGGLDRSASPAGQPEVPFREKGAKPADAVKGSSASPESAPPFHEPENLPAGTLLPVRLKSSVLANNPSANATFEAVVEQAVEVDGNQLLAAGTLVSGRVEAARASNLKRGNGYVPLTLDSIDLGGSKLPVQTSSLFVRGNARPTPAQTQASGAETAEDQARAVVRIEKGRRLVFRLTEPVYLAVSQATPIKH